jgi:hypothetical protein
MNTEDTSRTFIDSILDFIQSFFSSFYNVTSNYLGTILLGTSFVSFIALCIYFIVSLVQIYKTIKTYNASLSNYYIQVFQHDNFETTPPSKKEGFDESNSESNFPSIQYTPLSLTYTNRNYQKEMDTLLCHYYYLGSYLTGLIGGVTAADAHLSAVKKIIQQGSRCLHFSIFSSHDPVVTDKPLEPVLRTPYPIESFPSKSVSWNKVVQTVDDYAWFIRKKDPLFLYLELSKPILESPYLMKETFEPILKKLGNKLPSKKYGFAGRNGLFPVSKAPMKDMIGKVLLFTNVYPTNTIYDEYIHGCFEQVNPYIPLLPYKQAFYENGGFSVDISDMNEFMNTASQSVMAVYPETTKQINNITSPFSDVKNYSVLDPMQFGVSVVFLHQQIPDTQLQQAYKVFEKGSILRKPMNKEEFERIFSPSIPYTSIKEMLFWQPSPPPVVQKQSEENALTLTKVEGLNGYIQFTI